jgi:hypothetical protein
MYMSTETLTQAHMHAYSLVFVHVHMHAQVISCKRTSSHVHNCKSISFKTLIFWEKRENTCLAVGHVSFSIGFMQILTFHIFPDLAFTIA